ncbi:hypothetical protein GCM10027034_21670 [Ramlibacter solisilvae]|nr:DUF4142 domain-containing protein [Ramlibacter tataouinensis]
MNQVPFRAACIVGAFGCLIVSGCTSMPQDYVAVDGSTAAMGAPGMSAADRRFALVAAGTTRYDVRASELAMSEAADPRLRDFARMVAQDQQASSEELLSLLRARGIEPRSGLPPAKQEAMSSLAARDNGQFDNQYMRTVGMRDNVSDIVLLEQTASSASDPALRAWAEKNLPKLRARQTAAQELSKTMIGWDPIE